MTAQSSDGTIRESTVEAQEQRVVDMADFGADERARRLAEESRSFLEVEGFSNQRIVELANTFVAGELGADDEFTAWAMSEGRYASPGS
jgi:hypothetical protein